MEQPREIKAIIWDMGGVLLRSEQYCQRDELAARFNVTRSELENRVFNSDSANLATIGKISQKEHWHTTGLYFGMPEAEIPFFEEAFWSGDRCDEDLVNYIRSLQKKYKTGLLSNAWTGTREMLANKYRCIDAFDVAVFSYEVGMAKPDHRIYQHILAKLAVEPVNAIFVDDFIENVEAARELGIHAIHFLNREQVLGEVKQLITT